MSVPVSMEESVAVTLWRLATNIEYHTLSAAKVLLLTATAEVVAV